MAEPTPGTLFVVGTPIGNLGDITLRAAELLRRVAHVAAEDTRRTRALLNHLGSAARVQRLDAHSGVAQVDQLLGLLSGGQDVAVVTDAGMPAVSDPGSVVVRRARELGFDVRVLPGRAL